MGNKIFQSSSQNFHDINRIKAIINYRKLNLNIWIILDKLLCCFRYSMPEPLESTVTCEMYGFILPISILL